jgi:hypothetical protein
MKAARCPCGPSSLAGLNSQDIVGVKDMHLAALSFQKVLRQGTGSLKYNPLSVGIEAQNVRSRFKMRGFL